MDTSEPSYPSLWKKVAETNMKNKQTEPLKHKLLLPSVRNLYNLAIKIYLTKKYLKSKENMLIYLKNLLQLSIFVCLEKGHLIAPALGN